MSANPPEECAPWDGKVLGVEVWDLLSVEGGGIPADWYRPNDLVVHDRQLIRITLERTRLLAVGDKLANRHGHKGVVGAILPDREMPRWHGRPLEALLDPDLPPHVGASFQPR